MRNRFNFSGFPDLTRPQWAGREINPEDMLPGGSKLDEASFTAYTAPVTVTLTADAAVGATALAVAALSAGLPAGTVLNFGTALGMAITTKAAAAAAVALTVQPLVNPLTTGQVAQFKGQYGITVPAGTFVSRTYAQRAAGTGFHPAIDAEDEYFLTAHDVRDLTLDNDVSLVMKGDFPIKENFLPNYGDIAAVANVLAKLRANYVCTIGA